MDTLRLFSILLLLLLLFSLSYDFYLAVKYVESDASKDIVIAKTDIHSTADVNSKTNSNDNTNTNTNTNKAQVQSQVQS